MNILVTGAGGYVGRALVKQLRIEGHTIHALIHNYTPPEFSQLDIKILRGDITDQHFIQQQMKDVDAIIHCAALVKDYGPRNEFYNINLKATQQLANTSPPQLTRFIYLSHICYENQVKSHYSRSKLAAEQWLLNKYIKENFPCVVLRPGNIFGPAAPTWVIRPLNQIHHGHIALIENGQGIFLHTYLDNLIKAISQTLTTPDIEGKAFNITDGDNSTTWKHYFNSLAHMIHHPKIKKKISRRTAIFLGKLSLFSYHLFKTKPFITPFAVQILTNTQKVSILDAQKYLNYTPHVSYHEALNKIHQWIESKYLIENKHIKKY